jgi:hypothetical protein
MAVKDDWGRFSATARSVFNKERSQAVPEPDSRKQSYLPITAYFSENGQISNDLPFYFIMLPVEPQTFPQIVY